MDQLHAGFRLNDDEEIPQNIINRKFTKKDLEEFKVILARSYNLENKKDGITADDIIITFNDDYIFYKISQTKLSQYRRAEFEKGTDKSVIIFRINRYKEGA
jgi:hypothetical protein